jgi:hypothetical protein
VEYLNHIVFGVIQTRALLEEKSTVLRSKLINDNLFSLLNNRLQVILQFDYKFSEQVLLFGSLVFYAPL